MYRLIKTKNPNNEFDIFNVTIENDGDNDNMTLPELSKMFHRFLKACGFNCIEKVVFIDDDGKEITGGK